jgi:hypothetical protein
MSSYVTKSADISKTPPPASAIAPARAENRRNGLLSTLRSHTKPP